MEFQKYNVKKKKKRRRRRKIKRENKQTNKNNVAKVIKKIQVPKLIPNTKKHKLKILSRVWNCRYMMLYERRRERNRGGKKSHRNKKNYRYKIDNIYQKAKIKNLE